MTEPGPGEGVDVRTDRVVQATVGVLLLAAFVFRFPWLPPILAVALAVGAALGPRFNPFHWVFDQWIEPRLPASSAGTVPAEAVRAQDALGAAILFLAGVLYLMGLGPPAWLLTIAEAVIAVIAATTRIHVGDELLHLIRHH